MRTNGLLLMFFVVQPEKDNIERFSFDMKKNRSFSRQSGIFIKVLTERKYCVKFTQSLKARKFYSICATENFGQPSVLKMKSCIKNGKNQYSFAITKLLEGNIYAFTLQ